MRKWSKVICRKQLSSRPPCPCNPGHRYCKGRSGSNSRRQRRSRPPEGNPKERSVRILGAVVGLVAKVDTGEACIVLDVHWLALFASRNVNWNSLK